MVSFWRATRVGQISRSCVSWPHRALTMALGRLLPLRAVFFPPFPTADAISLLPCFLAWEYIDSTAFARAKWLTLREQLLVLIILLFTNSSSSVGERSNARQRGELPILLPVEVTALVVSVRRLLPES